MNKLVKNYIYNTLYQIFLIVVPLITAPFLTRTLSSNSLGIYDYVNSIVSIITTFGLLGLQSYGYRQIAYFRDNKLLANKEFSSIFQLRVLLLAIITIIYLPVVCQLEYKNFFLIQYALIAAQFLDVSWVFIGFEDLGIVSFRNFIAKFITVVGIFIFIKDDSGLWIYFALFAFITLITTISIYPMMRKHVRFQKTNIKESFKHLVPTTKLFIPQIATLLYLQFDKIMLKQITESASQVAYYAYAEKIINIPLAVITALGTVMMPRLANLHSNNNKEVISQYLKKTIEFAMFLSIPMMAGLIAISKGFIPWYLGEEYLASAIAIVVLSPLCILNALTNILGAQYLTAINKTNVLTIAYYSAAIINIVLNAILIPHYGYIGAAIATVVCSLVSVIIQYIYVRKEIALTGILKQIAKNTLSAVVMFVATSLIAKIAPVTIWATALEIAVGCISYVAVSFVLKDEILSFVFKKSISLILRRKPE